MSQVPTELRSGYTTGACAAAAAKAAALHLFEGDCATAIDIPFPDGTREALPIEFLRVTETGAEAAVRKDAGDDPDITDGSLVLATVTLTDTGGITFAAGEGVGTVTLPGLQIPPGEPAINPGPRAMITAALREVSPGGFHATISIQGGKELAAKTFNPRLGVEGGLSILGTSGRVRPFSAPALRDALACSLDVAKACGITNPILVPGNFGEKAARAHFTVQDHQIISVSNEWGFMLDEAQKRNFSALLLVGHPGKLAKLIDGEWDTHSSRSGSAVPIIARLAQNCQVPITETHTTVEGLFAALSEPFRKELGQTLAADIGKIVQSRISGISTAIALINMQGDLLGTDGDLQPWK